MKVFLRYYTDFGISIPYFPICLQEGGLALLPQLLIDNIIDFANCGRPPDFYPRVIEIEIKTIAECIFIEWPFNAAMPESMAALQELKNNPGVVSYKMSGEKWG